MKDFISMMRRYVKPYNKNVWGSVLMNVLSAVFNIFSFTLIIPILNILFQLNKKVYTFIPWDAAMGFKEKLINNAYWYVSRYMIEHGAIVTLLALAGFMIIMTALKTGCYFGSTAVMVPLRTGIVRDMRMQIYNKILNLPLGFFSEERKGDIIARMSGDVSEVENSIAGSIDMLIKNPILIFFYIGTMVYISWKLTLFVLVFAPLMMWLMGVIGRNLRRRSTEAQMLWSDTMSQVEETLGGLRIIKAFLAEKKMSRRFSNVTNAMRRKNAHVATRQALAHPVSEFLGTVMICIVLCFGGTLIIMDKSFIDAPTFIFYMVILYSVIQPIKDLAKAAYNIPKGLASMERIDRILMAGNTIKEAPDAKEIKSFEKDISFSNVNFSYDGSAQVLHDINIHINKGQKIAIVGASGGGKSTLVDLLPRFYDVTSGTISIDGQNIKDLKIQSLRSLMGNVNQDPILFNDTIYNNIAFGVENATMEDVVAAAKIANAHEFILEKEDGYETNIGDRGIKLSGGQRQRISIARAILKNPPILILDEATAALDTQSERLVQEALERLMSKRTTIAIAHRLSTIKDADEIIVVEAGRIVERGGHDELIEKNGYYKKLYDMQAL
jgi:ATP-binding cassette subfamily B protein/subfamily B ATP-binding cassette protein MsbA